MQLLIQRLAHDHYKEIIYPHLLRGPTGNNDEMWFIGANGRGIPFYSIYASALLPNLGPGNCVIVPQAPVEVLEHLGELLHTGYV